MFKATKAELLTLTPKFEDVAIEQLGKTVRVRGLSLGGRKKYQAALVEIADGQLRMRSDADVAGIVPLVLAETLVDENMQPLFESADELAGMDPQVADDLFAVARRLSGLDEGAAEAAAKN